MEIFYYTFGCKVNQYETENIREAFSNDGHDEVTDYAHAQVCIVNSCTVTAQSDLKCRQLVRKIKKENPKTILVLAGCMTQATPDIDKILPECDIIAGSQNKTKIPQLVYDYIDNRTKIVEIVPHNRYEKFEIMSNKSVDSKTRAYIKIQDGCDQYCTYCIIPYARGHIRSKSLDTIVNETMTLVSSGHKELVLTGINLCCYGKDLTDNIRLIDAIEACCCVDGDFRVRLGSLEPEMLSDGDIDRMSKQAKLCPQFHLSLQSGCDKTLKEMNRHYNCSEFSLLVEKLRDKFPECAITTDIMVGFPNETEEDFQCSLDFAREVRFADAHIFPYSRRAGTVADKMKNQLDKKTKHTRALKMAEVCKITKAEYLDSFVGKMLNVLFEKETSADYHQGYSDEYICVKVENKADEPSWKRNNYQIKILRTDGENLYGVRNIM